MRNINVSFFKNRTDFSKIKTTTNRTNSFNDETTSRNRKNSRTNSSKSLTNSNLQNLFDSLKTMKTKRTKTYYKTTKTKTLISWKNSHRKKKKKIRLTIFICKRCFAKFSNNIKFHQHICDYYTKKSKFVVSNSFFYVIFSIDIFFI